MRAMTEPLLLNKHEAARLLGISHTHLGRLAIAGRIKSIKIGARRKFNREEIERVAREGIEPIGSK